MGASGATDLGDVPSLQDQGEAEHVTLGRAQSWIGLVARRGHLLWGTGGIPGQVWNHTYKLDSQVPQARQA